MSIMTMISIIHTIISILCQRASTPKNIETIIHLQEKNFRRVASQASASNPGLVDLQNTGTQFR